MKFYQFIGLKKGFKTLQFNCRTLVVRKNLYIRMYEFKYKERFTYRKSSDVPHSLVDQISLPGFEGGSTGTLP